MEINSDTEQFEVDPTTLIRTMNSKSNKEEDRKELYLEHLRMITSEAIKAAETEFSELCSYIKA